MQRTRGPPRTKKKRWALRAAGWHVVQRQRDGTGGLRWGGLWWGGLGSQERTHHAEKIQPRLLGAARDSAAAYVPEAALPCSCPAASPPPVFRSALADAPGVPPSPGPACVQGGDARPTSGPLGASKKDPEVRRRELLGGGGGGGASLAAALVQLCAERAGELIRSQHGSDVLVEVCRGGEGGLLESCLEGAGASLAGVHDALVASVAGGADATASAAPQQDSQQGGEEEPVLSHFFGSRALRRLVLASGDGGGSGAAAGAFAAKLWAGALRGRCRQWVGTHAEKVLAALAQCGEAATKAAARKELAPLVGGSLDEWAAKLTAKQPPAAAGKRQGKGKQQQQQHKQPHKQQREPSAEEGKQQPRKQRKKA